MRLDLIKCFKIFLSIFFMVVIFFLHFRKFFFSFTCHILSGRGRSWISTSFCYCKYLLTCCYLSMSLFLPSIHKKRRSIPAPRLLFLPSVCPVSFTFSTPFLLIMSHRNFICFFLVVNMFQSLMH